MIRFISLFLLFINVLGVKAQVTELSDEAYEAITFNGVTVSQLEMAKGDVQKMHTLLGEPTELQEYSETMPPEAIKAYYYDENVIRFSNGELFFIRINTTDFPLSVLGKSIYVGQTLDQVKTQLGHSLVKTYESNGYVWVAFGSPINDYDSIDLAFDPITKKIVFMIYSILA